MWGYLAAIMLGLVSPWIAAAAYAQSAAYSDGLADRTAYESWVASLDAMAKAGADYWASQRSLRNPGRCISPDGKADGSWVVGCREAKSRLDPADTRRLTEPDYRLGWNAFQQAAPASVAANTPSFVMPANADSLPASGPPALCRQPDIIRNIIKSLSDVKAVKDAHESVYDFEDSKTLGAELQSLTFSCHGIARITNGQMLPGTFTVFRNSAGDAVWRWMNDGQPGPSAVLPQAAVPGGTNLRAADAAPAPVLGTSGDHADLPAVEIASWNWRKDPSWGSNGIIHWTVEVKNKSDRNIESAKIEFSTYDAKNKIVSSTFAFVDAIAAGGARAAESFADLYGTEAAAHVQVVYAKFAN